MKVEKSVFRTIEVFCARYDAKVQVFCARYDAKVWAMVQECVHESVLPVLRSFWTNCAGFCNAGVCRNARRENTSTACVGATRARVVYK